MGRELPDSELADYYMRKTVAEIRGDFPRWAGLVLRKSYYFLNDYERSDIKPVQRFVERYSSVLKLPLLSYAVVMPLGMVGLAASLWKRKKHALVPVAGMLSWAALTIGFFVIWRYRLPAVPFMAMLAGYAVYAIYRAVAGRRYVALAAMLAGALALNAVSTSTLFGAADDDYLPTHVVNEGAIYEAAARYEEAVAIYAEARDMAPSDARPYYHMGRTYAAMGRMTEARDYMARAMALNPNYRPFAYVSLGIATAKREAYGEAAGYFEKALEADPGLCIAAYNLGLCQYNLGRQDEALETLLRASEACRDDAGAAVSIAKILIQLGEVDRGISLAGAALEVDPHNPEALYVAGLGYEARGSYAEAAACFERALAYMPSSKELRDKIEQMRTMDNP